MYFLEEDQERRGLFSTILRYLFPSLLYGIEYTSYLSVYKICRIPIFIADRFTIEGKISYAEPW
jgi:hypothetical protein